MYISLLERKLFPNASPYQHSRRRYVAFIFLLATTVLIAVEYRVFGKFTGGSNKSAYRPAPWAQK